MLCGAGAGRERLRSEGDCSVYDEEYRIVVAGTQGVGKTAICQVYVGGREEEKDCERLVVQKTAKFRRAEFCTWDTVDGYTCCMRLSELRMPAVTCESDLEDPILRGLTESADGILLVYSVIEADSFWATPTFYDLVLDIRNHADTPLVVVGNKADLVTRRVVTRAQGRDMAFDVGSSFYETSVKADPHGIKFVFHDVIRQARSVRMYARLHGHACANRVRGLIHRLSLKSKRRRSKSRSRLKLTATNESSEKT